MSNLTLHHVDTHRIDLRYFGRLLAYGIWDAFGWSLMQLHNGLWKQVQRVDDAPASMTLRDHTVRQLVAVGQQVFPSAREES